MISDSDLEKLRLLLRDFTVVTGMRASVMDLSGRCVLSFPESLPPLCACIHADPAAEKCCEESRQKLCQEAASKNAPFMSTCHAGLTVCVHPVSGPDGPVGIVLAGHLFTYDSRVAGWANIRAHCRKYDIDEERLRKITADTPAVTKGYAVSSLHLLAMALSGMYAEHLREVSLEDPMEEIDRYLKNHFAEDIDIDELAKTFGLGRTSLYERAGEFFGCGIAEQIRRLRIHNAQEMLLDGRGLSIAYIAESSGYSDPNYFSTVFRRECGMPPAEYRRRKLLDAQKKET